MATKTVVRVLVYTGPEADVDHQIACSVPDGFRLGGGVVTIRSLTLTKEEGQILMRAPVAIGETGIGQLQERLDKLPPAGFGPLDKGHRKEAK